LLLAAATIAFQKLVEAKKKKAEAAELQEAKIRTQLHILKEELSSITNSEEIEEMQFRASTGRKDLKSAKYGLAIKDKHVEEMKTAIKPVINIIIAFANCPDLKARIGFRHKMKINLIVCGYAFQNLEITNSSRVRWSETVKVQYICISNSGKEPEKTKPVYSTSKEGAKSVEAVRLAYPSVSVSRRQCSA